MRSIERRFNYMREKNLRLSSFVCFSKAIYGQSFSSSMIHRWFSKLIDPDDYSKSEKREILRYLDDIVKASRTTETKKNLTIERVIAEK